MQFVIRWGGKQNSVPISTGFESDKLIDRLHCNAIAPECLGHLTNLLGGIVLVLYSKKKKGEKMKENYTKTTESREKKRKRGEKSHRQ